MISNNYEKPNEQYENEINNNEISITKYLGEPKEVRIPETFEGYLFTSIGNLAFVNKPLTSDTIPNSVTYTCSF